MFETLRPERVARVAAIGLASALALSGCGRGESFPEGDCFVTTVGSTGTTNINDALINVMRRTGITGDLADGRFTGLTDTVSGISVQLYDTSKQGRQTEYPQDIISMCITYNDPNDPNKGGKLHPNKENTQAINTPDRIPEKYAKLVEQLQGKMILKYNLNPTKQERRMLPPLTGNK